LGTAQRYAAILADAGVDRGLIGPREVPRLWDRHLVNCGLIAQTFDPGGSLCDLGSGAGLPGVVIAILRPDLHVTVLEPLLRRTVFLEQVVDDLGLSQVSVLRGRAEEQRDQRFDAVTARAVAPLDRLARWALPMCRPAGRLVAIKGESAAEELATHAQALRRLGATAWSVKRFTLGTATSVAIEVVAGNTESRSDRSDQGRRSGGKRNPKRRRT
jgi:16S rRNA (guanine527-N7)-methyltransferase